MIFSDKQERLKGMNLRKCHLRRRAATSVWLLLVGVCLLAAIVATTVFLNQKAWVEIVGNGVLRTNAPSKIVAASIHEVIHQHQNYVLQEDGKKSDPSYKGRSKSWSTGPAKDEIRVKVTRAKTEIVDKNGHSLSIEKIDVTNAPTLIFIEFSDPNGPSSIANEIVQALRSRGVEGR